jgi:hypothetical protein
LHSIGHVRVIRGRYELGERVGGGGMADVFRAHDRTLDRDVAVKVMRPAFARIPEFVERFHREGEALGAIDHPNIVRVLDYGASSDGPFIVMELVSGGTLGDLMRARGRVDQYEAASIAAGIADGLEAAHVRGVLHRDLKPDNVLLDGEGQPKIADFGIARLAAATAITRTGELLGTPQYLAPEQMAGEVVDERVDVYALGVILYEMLTGRQPTGGTTPSEIVSRRLRMDPRPPARDVPLEPALNALVLRALARDPGHRVRRASALRDALLAIKRPAPVSSSPRAPRLQMPTLAPFAASFSALWTRLLAIEPPAVPAIPRVTVPAVRLPSLAPLAAGLALAATNVREHALRFDRAVDSRVAALAAAVRGIRPPQLPAVPRPRWPSFAPVASRLAAGPATTRVRIARPPRRSPAALLAALALLAAFVGGSFAFAGARPTAPAPVAIATSTPASTAVLARTSTPEVTPAPTPEPTMEPTPEPTAAPTPAPVVTVTGDPAGTILTFYQLISGHDYVSASGLWSDRMKASYPPQTNIWGRFDATSSIVARAASLTSVNPSSAAVSVDLIETRSDGSVRHWVGTWYLVRSGSGWLLDQPGLRAA